MLDRIQAALELPKVDTGDEALETIATAFALRHVRGQTTDMDALAEISQLCFDESFGEGVGDFHMLYEAMLELQVHDVQHCWPVGSQSNMDDVIRNYCRQWLENHPLLKWHDYEWAETYTKPH